MFSKIYNSPSSALVFCFAAFASGVTLCALFFRDALYPQAAPLVLCLAATALAALVFVKNKRWRLASVAALLFVLGAARYVSSSQSSADLSAFFPFLNYAKEWLVSAVAKMLPEPHAGFLDGLLVGTGAGSPEIKAAFAATGTAHVMALSGWNVTLISGWTDRLLAFFRLKKTKRLALGALLVAVFVIATGASASLLRAAIMGFLVTAAAASGRRSAPRRAVVFAAGAMLAISPRIIVNDLGFALSVAATLGLVYLSPFFKPFSDRLPDRFNISETVAGTLGATLATLPITLAVFGQTSLVALPANLLLLPFIAPTMAVGFICAALSSTFPPLISLCAWIASLFTNYDLSLVKALARIPGASLTGVYVGPTAAVLMAAGLAFVVIKNHDRFVEEEN
jgi:ComEC/Rec2-related protein